MVVRAGTEGQGSGNKPNPPGKTGGGGGGGGDDGGEYERLWWRIRFLLVPFALIGVLLEKKLNTITGWMLEARENWIDFTIEVSESKLIKGLLSLGRGGGDGGGDGCNYGKYGAWIGGDDGGGAESLLWGGYNFREWMEQSETDEDQEDMTLGQLYLANKRDARQVFGKRRYQKERNGDSTMRMQRKKLAARLDEDIALKRKPYEKLKQRKQQNPRYGEEEKPFKGSAWRWKEIEKDGRIELPKQLQPKQGALTY
eukprot:CAMPEP_0167762674 /NCGR_PEP_ID=MMETSP0110_2-20121227/12913_1 /TAXON_ID=629695 /ORGANISM="Gymnochlora sp., Strain CCMP2014" /LENGTH=254 /DNA_ID=CAMNT_0007649603 /DNA_START=288 /DNA_END=1052 /DNA_ORIENTATION=+